MAATEYASKNVTPAGTWTRTRCGRGHLAEHPRGVEESDFADCWCGAPRVAATCYRISETGGQSSAEKKIDTSAWNTSQRASSSFTSGT